MAFETIKKEIDLCRKNKNIPGLKYVNGSMKIVQEMIKDRTILILNSLMYKSKLQS